MSRTLNQEVTKFTAKSLKRLKKSLRTFARNANTELLHDARVEIKKIRAVLRMLKANDENFRLKKTFMPFRTIFRDCAGIREPLVIEALAKTYRVKQYCNHHNNQKEISALQSNSVYFIESIESVKKSIFTAVNSVKDKWLRKYMKEKSEFLKSLLYPTFQLKNIHGIRKLLKEVFYLESILKINKRYLKFLKDSSTITGDWHDDRLLMAKIRKRAPVSAIERIQTANRFRIVQLRKLVAEFYGE